MNRYLAILLTLPLCLAGLSRIPAAEPAFGKQPNIILVITDDQGYYDLSCHGNPHLETPNLDKLRAESLRFTRFQVSPTCAPTRSASAASWLTQRMPRPPSTQARSAASHEASEA